MASSTSDRVPSQSFLIEPKTFKLLIGHINAITSKIKWMRQYVYLLTLWFASTSPLTAAEREYTVPKLSTVNTTFLFLEHFDRTKSAYTVLDKFVEREGWATRRVVGHRTLYKITDEGARRAQNVLDQWELNREHRIEASAAQQPALHKPLLSRLPGPPAGPSPSMLEELERHPAALYDILTTVDLPAAEDMEDETLPFLTPEERKVLVSYKRIADALHVTPEEAHASK